MGDWPVVIRKAARQLGWRIGWIGWMVSLMTCRGHWTAEERARRAQGWNSLRGWLKLDRLRELDVGQFALHATPDGKEVGIDA